MGFNRGPKITTNGLVAYFDVSNPKCVDATQTIDSNTRLNNLVGGTLKMQPYDTSNGNMSFVSENGSYVYDQNGINSGYPCWNSTINPTRVDNYTFICWFKYNYGGGTQRGNNIYGGGFNGRTSFYLSPGGTSSSHGVLRYSDVGGTNSYSVTGNNGGNDGNWHQFAATDEGGDGNQTTKFYIDGVLKQSGTSNGSHDTPDGTSQMTWGSWSNTYGNFNGRSNCYMYYERTLSADEILDVYNATKGRFQ